MEEKMEEIKNDFQHHQQELYLDHLLTEGLSMHGKSTGFDGDRLLPFPPQHHMMIHSSSTPVASQKNYYATSSPKQLQSGSLPSGGIATSTNPPIPPPVSTSGIGGGGGFGPSIVDAILTHEDEIDGNIQHLVGGLLYEHIKHYPQRENLLRTGSGGVGTGTGTGGTSTPTVSNITLSNPGSRNSSRPSTPRFRTSPSGFPSPNRVSSSGVGGVGSSGANANGGGDAMHGNPHYFYNIGNHPSSGNLVGLSHLTAHDAFPNTAFYPVHSPSNHSHHNGPAGSANKNSSIGSGGKRPISPDVSEVTLFTEAKQSVDNSPVHPRDGSMKRKGNSPLRSQQNPSNNGGGGSGGVNNVTRRNGSPSKRTSTTPTATAATRNNTVAGGRGVGNTNGTTGPSGPFRLPSPTRTTSSPTKMNGRNVTPATATNNKQYLKTPVVAGSSPAAGPTAKRSVNHRISPRLVSPDHMLSPSAKRAAVKIAMHSPPPKVTQQTPVSKRNILNSAVGGRDLSFGRNGSMLGPFNLMTKELTDEQYKKFNQADLETLHRQLKLLKLQLKSKISCDRVENESMIKKLWLLVTTKEDEAYATNIQERSMEEFIRVHQRLLEIVSEFVFK